MEKRQDEQKGKKKHPFAVAIIIFVGSHLFLRALVAFVPLEKTEKTEFPLTLNIHEYPDKLVYVMGKDTELDLTGGKICFSEFGEGLNGFSCESCKAAGLESNNNCQEIFNMVDIPWYTTNVNFNEPGIYLIRFTRNNGGSCGFAVEVIDPAALE